MLTTIQITAEAGKFQEMLVDMLVQIGDVVPRFQIYERLYRNHERLLVALSKVYFDILLFCTRTKDFFLNAKQSMSMLLLLGSGRGLLLHSSVEHSPQRSLEALP